ncbi:MAG: cysteine desulfurase-like protein [Actinomycetota bacterium]|nr:cysteine desulfurase-like protein [Actinomycetota bacterium]
MTGLTDISCRFPGLADGWARFDGPAGTQVVDTAIDAAADWQRSGTNANSHGAFPAAQACDDLVDLVSATMGELLRADPAGMVYGPSTTANMMTLTRAVAQSLKPGDEIICTTLDHDANVAPWLLAARDAEAVVHMAAFDPTNGRLPTEAVTSLISSVTRWVAVTGSSNVIGTMPDIAAITAEAHAAGARVVIDGVHLTPHRSVDLTEVTCDVYVTSSYKWYGPHAGIMWVEPTLLDELSAYKVRPAPDRGPGRLQYGTPSWEALAGIDAAARFLLDTGFDNIVAHESARFSRLLTGLAGIPGVRVIGPQDEADRAPTLLFLVDGHTPEEVSAQLAESRIAVWDGHNYAVEAMNPLGLGEAGAVRAGVCVYISDEDVDRLLAGVAAL